MRAFVLGFLTAVILMFVSALAGLVVIGHALAIEDPLSPADVIVAVSGDNGPRTEMAVSLWKQKLAPLILFSGGSLDPESVSSAELMKRDAVLLGVPAEAILIEPLSTSTEENADFTAALMKQRGLHTAILVTSPFHQRRASILFSQAFAGSGLLFLNHPAVDPQWNPDRWWLTDPPRRQTLVELAKLGAVIVGSR